MMLLPNPFKFTFYPVFFRSYFNINGEVLVSQPVVLCYIQELTYDYGYELDSVIGPDGKIRELACHCGADGCRKRLY